LFARAFKVPARKRRFATSLVAVFVAVLVLVLAAQGPDLHASVSVALTFDDLVQRATAAAVVVPVDQHGVWEGGRIATYTRARVERLVAGHLPEEISLRTYGGAVGRIGQLVEGEATFAAGAPSLVFVHPLGDAALPGTFAVVEGAQGQFSIVKAGDQPARLAPARNVGAVVALPPAAPRPARDVLAGKLFEDAVRAIGAMWSRVHPASEAR
jgi:hypothetical protein